MIQNIISVLFLSCRKATELTEKQKVIDLTVRERAQLKMHFSMCKACAAYARQSRIINKALRKWVDEQENPTKTKLPEDVKQQIISEVEEKSKN